MDTTATNEIGSSPATVAAASPVISPPTKTRRTKSPQKRSSNENFNNRLPKNQSSLHRFFTSSQATPSSKNMGELNGGSAAAAISDDDDEDDIQVVSEKISNFGTTISDNECQIIEPK
uniref:Uncharacterized protein n=1 Tax=Panagrolaimus sp. ES5 TaxID=591445 RepID=A0AC34G6V8_9BILA